jgi:hypothetical protein
LDLFKVGEQLSGMAAKGAKMKVAKHNDGQVAAGTH